MKLSKAEALLFARRVKRDLESSFIELVNIKKDELYNSFFNTKEGKKVKSLLDNADTKGLINMIGLNTYLKVPPNYHNFTEEQLVNEIMIANLEEEDIDKVLEIAKDSIINQSKLGFNVRKN